MRMIDIMADETGNYVKAEDVVQQAQKIAVLMQLSTFLKASKLGVAGEVGATIKMELLDRHHTTLFINSKLLENTLLAEFNKLGQELTDAGVDLENMLDGEKKRFDQMYGVKEE